MALTVLEGASRRLVLDGAARLFRRDGYAAVSLRAIAAECGMKAGSLYYHFDSKEVIVVEVLNIGVQRVHAAVAEALAAVSQSAPMARRLDAAIAAHLRALHEAGDYTSANIRIFGQVPPAIRSRHMPVRRAYGDLWTALLRDGVATGALRREMDVATLRAFLLGAMNSSLEWLMPQNGAVARVAVELSRLVLDGAAADARPV